MVKCKVFVRGEVRQLVRRDGVDGRADKLNIRLDDGRDLIWCAGLAGKLEGLKVGMIVEIECSAEASHKESQDYLNLWAWRYEVLKKSA